jgi:hypothetical protein
MAVIVGRIKYHPTFADVCASNLIVLPGFCAEFTDRAHLGLNCKRKI